MRHVSRVQLRSMHALTARGNTLHHHERTQRIPTLFAGTKGVGRRGTHSHKSKKTHKIGLRATFLERHIDQVPTSLTGLLQACSGISERRQCHSCIYKTGRLQIHCRTLLHRFGKTSAKLIL